MSSPLVIWRTSEYLIDLLWQEVNADGRINNPLEPIVPSRQAITLMNPTDTAKNQDRRLSLWLYHITENEFAKNQPPIIGNGDNTLSRTPLALDLYYLITPFTESIEKDHQLIGKIMQVMYDNAILPVVDINDDISEELRIILCRLTLEEQTRIWEALNEPYRLSICYRIRVTHIESERSVGAKRVVERTGEFGGVPEDAL